MRKFATILFFIVTMMCSTVFAQSSYDYEDTMTVGQMWKMQIVNVAYEIYPQSRAALVEYSGEEWIKFIEAGDVEIITHDLDTNRSYRALIHITPDENNISRMYAGEPPAADQTQFAEQVLHLVNIERAKIGVAPLRLSKELMDACAIRAREIVQSFSHTRPNGQSFNTLIREGIYTAGENIAAGSSTPEAVVQQWMNSPGHRANILNSDYTELGVGYTYAENSTYTHYWVQIFKRPMARAYRL